jgi:hypothetical protein
MPAILNGCSSTSCHGTADLTKPALGSVNLIAPGVESRLYNIDATYANIAATDPMDCPSPAEKLLDPVGGLQTSLMYTKVNGGHVCGGSMPTVGELEPAEITCYNEWLQSILDKPPN